MTLLEKAIDKASELLAKREDENEYHLHDIDRKWVIEAMMDYAEYVLSGTSSHIEISDEEIKNIVDEIYPNANGSSKLLVSGFIQGCRWYREQLKSK